MPQAITLRELVRPSPLIDARDRVLRRTRLDDAFRSLLRHQPAVLLSAALAGPAVIGAVAVGRFDVALLAALVGAIAAALQAALQLVGRRVRRLTRRDRQLIQLLVALGAAAILIELVMPASYSLYLPVVAMAAAVGMTEGVVVALTTVVLYLVPVVAAPGALDPDVVARGVAGVGVSVLIAVGSRHFVGMREEAARDFRAAARRERRRSRQLSGVEEVGRLLAVAGPTKEALHRIVDVLATQFGYRFVSIYLGRPDGIMELGAQRGYDAPFESFDGTSGIVGRVMRRRDAELVVDVSSDPDYVPAHPDVVSEVCAPLLDDGQLLGFLNVESVGGALDVSDRRAVVAVADRLAAYIALGRERQRLAELSARDPLTGLFNRRTLEEQIIRVFAQRARLDETERRPVAVVLFDLDHFGKLNKDHGHATGDEVLRTVGRLLRRHFRASDVVARYGGEEFVALLDGAALSDAAARAEEVRASLAAAIPRDADPHLRITVSAGCASIEPAQDASWDDLLAAADVALGMAKRAGRNQVVCASV